MNLSSYTIKNKLLLIKTGHVFRHYKGGYYKIIILAKHSDTLEEVVVYKTLYKNNESQIWVRPIKDFIGLVKIAKGKTVNRFQYVSAFIE